MNKLSSFIAITRLNSPIGIYLLLYPSLIALAFASNALLNSGLMVKEESLYLIISSLVIVILGSILVRSTGCVINDIFDYKLDMRVQRTKERPLASGALEVKEAWIIFAILGSLSIALLMQTNSQTIFIGCIAALLIIFYPLTKRFLLGPQFFLAITFGSCIPIVFSMLGQLNNEVLILLYIGNAAWIISYDTYYAMSDAEDDIKIGVNSTPLWWKDKTIFIINIFKLIFIGCLIIIGVIKAFSYIWFMGMLLVCACFYQQNKLAKKKKFLEAFKSNNYVGLIVFILVVIELNLVNLIL
tara:strand:- start:1671 stop:2567 length:897 start_codon:yes stop_codon:yes gene_type:complete